MMVRAVIDFPEPDSPTRPRDSPRSMAKLASWITERSRRRIGMST